MRLILSIYFREVSGCCSLNAALERFILQAVFDVFLAALHKCELSAVLRPVYPLDADTAVSGQVTCMSLTFSQWLVVASS